MDNHIAAKASFDFEGVTFTLSPVTISELKELESYLRARPLEEVRNSLDGLSPEDRRHILDRAYDEMRKSPIRIANKEFNEAVQSFDSVVYLLFLSLRKHHADILRADCGRMLQSALSTEISDKLLQVSGLGGTSEKKTMKAKPIQTAA